MAVSLSTGDALSIYNYAREYGCTREQTAYILATAYWETARTMRPVRETMADTTAKAVKILERAWAQGRLRWVKTAYWRYDAEGKSWLGRGYVQLTHRSNYVKAGKLLRLNLVSEPDTAMRPQVAKKILVHGMMEGWFTGQRLPEFINEERVNWLSARSVVNGTDRAHEIAELAGDWKLELEQVWHTESNRPQLALWSQLVARVRAWLGLD